MTHTNHHHRHLQQAMALSANKLAFATKLLQASKCRQHAAIEKLWHVLSIAVCQVPDHIQVYGRVMQ